MSLSDFLWGDREKLDFEDMRYPYQITGMKDLYKAAEPGAIERLNRAGQSYPGQLGADPTQAQNWSFDALNKWLQSDTPMDDNLWGLSRQEYERTLGGDYYDPAEGQYYKALKSNVLRELAEAKDRLAATTSARDRYFSSGRVAGEGELEEDAIGTLAQVVGSLMERERERRLGAVPGAMGLMAQEEMYPQQRIAAAQEFGSLERDIQLQNQQMKYTEWIRALQDLGIPLEVAYQIAAYNPERYYPIYSFEPGMLGGPSGTSIQPRGGYGDYSRAADMGKWIASLIAGGYGGGFGGMMSSGLSQFTQGAGGGT